MTAREQKEMRADFGINSESSLTDRGIPTCRSAAITDDLIEEAAEKLIQGKPLTRRERRLLESPQADFAMGQVRAILKAWKRP